MKTAQFWKTLPEKKVECQLCPRNCIIPDGGKGYCFIRQNKQGVLYSAAYAHPAAVNIDPIEKKPLYHFLPGSLSFSIGTFGCNLGCTFCQNWSLSRGQEDLPTTSQLDPEQIIRLCQHRHCQSVSFTYNEPTIFAEYLMDIAALAHQNEIKTVMVTNGYINADVIETVYKNIDAANVDLKAFSESFYKNETFGALQPVLNTLQKLKQLGVWIEITNLIIPGLNDDEDLIIQMLDWIVENLGDEVPLHFSVFHPDYKMTDRKRTSSETIIRTRELAMKKGLKYIYTGNLYYPEGSTTFCPECHSQLISRDWNHTTNNLVNNIKCQCGKIIPGIWH